MVSNLATRPPGPWWCPSLPRCFLRTLGQDCRLSPELPESPGPRGESLLVEVERRRPERKGSLPAVEPNRPVQRCRCRPSPSTVPRGGRGDRRGGQGRGLDNERRLGEWPTRLFQGAEGLFQDGEGLHRDAEVERVGERPELPVEARECGAIPLPRLVKCWFRGYLRLEAPGALPASPRPCQRSPVANRLRPPRQGR